MTTESERMERLAATLMRATEERMIEAANQRRQWTHNEYLYDKTQEKYWDRVNKSLLGAEAVDASIPQDLWRVVVAEAPEADENAPPRRGRPRLREQMIRPSLDIRRVENDLQVETSTWWPGKPEIIHDVYVDETGPRPSHGSRIYNTYRAPLPPPDGGGDGDDAAMWVEHVKRLYPVVDEHENLFNVLAHMVQHPAEKCNTALVLSGRQGIGKDLLLLPVKVAVGSWNVQQIDPDELFSQFKPWLRSKMLVIDEVRPHKEDFTAKAFYNALKPLIAAPPDVLPMNDKFQKRIAVINVMTVVITTNDLLSLYMPEGDRRMLLLNSPLAANWHMAAGMPGYFIEYMRWLTDGGGMAAVHRWLSQRSLEGFNPKAPPVKTAAWGEVAGSWGEAEIDPLRDAIEALGSPDVFFGSELIETESGFPDGHSDLRRLLASARKLAHRMLDAGYVMVPCDTKKWEFESKDKRFKSAAAYARRDLGWTKAEAIAALRKRGRALVSGE